MPIFTLRAKLDVQIGTRIRYWPQPPTTKKDDDSVDEPFKKLGEAIAAVLEEQVGDPQELYNKYVGRVGTIVNFTTERVLPLDSSGRWPGEYYSGFGVRFDGDYEVLYPNGHDCEIIDGPVEVPKVGATNSVHTKRQTLPVYPGDVVRVKGAPLQLPTIVCSIWNEFTGPALVSCDVVCAAAMETFFAERTLTAADTKELSTLFHDARRNLTDSFSSLELELLERGNVYWLYNDPTKLNFSSLEAELCFWEMDGLSDSVSYEDQFQFSLGQAKELQRSGQGELIVESKYSDPRDKKYSVRRIYDCFEPYRARVRELGLKQLLFQQGRYLRSISL